MARMIDTLREEHLNIEKLLDVLGRETDLAATAGNPDWNLLHAITRYLCDYPDRCHHPKEDAILARMQAKFPEKAKTIGDLLRERQEVRLRAQRFRDLVQSVFFEDVLPREKLVGAARAFINAERRHMMKEEAIFFPVAEKLLAEEDWQEIKSQLQNRPDLLSMASTAREFQAVRDALAVWKPARMAG